MIRVLIFQPNRKQKLKLFNQVCKSYIKNKYVGCLVLLNSIAFGLLNWFHIFYFKIYYTSSQITAGLASVFV